jgi:hypothetical protein
MYISFAINCSVKKKGPTILLTLTAHLTPTFIRWSRTSCVRCAFYKLQERLLFVFMYSCKSNHAPSEKNVNADQSHLQQQTVETNCKMNPASWIAWLQVVDYCCFISSKLLKLCCPSYTRLWHSSLSDFLGECSSLAPMSSNFSSVSTQHSCIKTPADISLFTKLRIVCLLGLLSSRNLHQNFSQHFLEDLYFTQGSHRHTCCSKVYHTMKKHTAH